MSFLDEPQSDTCGYWCSSHSHSTLIPCPETQTTLRWILLEALRSARWTLAPWWTFLYAGQQCVPPPPPVSALVHIAQPLCDLSL